MFGFVNTWRDGGNCSALLKAFKTIVRKGAGLLWILVFSSHWILSCLGTLLLKVSAAFLTGDIHLNLGVDCHLSAGQTETLCIDSRGEFPMEHSCFCLPCRGSPLCSTCKSHVSALTH